MIFVTFHNENELPVYSNSKYKERAKEWENQIENMVVSGIMELSRYEGIPKSWKTLDNSSGEVLNAVNPRYNRLLSPFADKGEVDYNISCANCVVAYEMRRWGYDVSAKELSENKKLSPEPWNVWKNAKIIQTNGSGLEDILEYVSKVSDRTRIQIYLTKLRMEKRNFGELITWR